MTAFKTLLAAFAAALILAAPVGAQAEEPRPFVYNITTDDAWAAGMALANANTAAARGHEVTVFLNVRGVHLADRDARTGTFTPAGKTPAELMAALIENGHTVLVCGACMSVAGVGEEDLIEGATKSGPDLTFGALEAPGAVVLSY
jgi:predicted peroxiredoxin